MLGPDSKIIDLNRVGKSLSGKLKKLGIETIRALFFYYPFRYDDFSRIAPINQLKVGMTATIKGRVDLLANRRSPRQHKILTEGLISDNTGSIKVIWFNQPWIAKNIKIGQEIFLAGKVSGDLFNNYFNSPVYERADLFNLNTARLAPVYPLTEGVSQKQLRFLIKTALVLVGKVADFLPAEISNKERLISLSRALKEIHFPKNYAALKLAQRKLAFNELFLIQVWVQLIKKNLGQKKSLKINFFQAETKNFISGLDFVLTIDQKKAAWEILRDLQKLRPMNRLLEGDVGSGKTLVAIIALYNVFLNKYQSAFMAPTEILARQHFETSLKFLERRGVKIGLITRSRKIINRQAVGKKEFLEKCQAGEIDLIIGTHAIIQKEIKFKKLALIIIDEQHRFGVEQRQLLKQKGRSPHLLSLTATPIPRSLALTLYGDLDLSLIRQMPAGRKKILTRIAPPEKRQLAYEFIAKQINLGRQVFVVCPLIDPSDKLGVRSVKQEFKKLDEEIFPNIKVGLLHGRLKAGQKEEVLRKFADNEIKILISTSVIEVGIDIPNASVMMIEGAERFGLAQLHQFRGRVGRSEHQSYCFLFSDLGDRQTLARLEVLVNCHDGFVLANKDLE
ncbi:ATP-dependent DNA helicase RecG, partial [Candidatus Falkowbacteria bacterium]|nr:ATP-dependent DNA helicase RecG [Candidatus Falkowbacteria bacterium]